MAAVPVTMPMDANAPIGVFDSGVGGLSVLRHIQQDLPGEHLLYFSDARFAPYGGLPAEQIEARALIIGAYLMERGVKAVVVACNTATAVAIAALRRTYPELILVGVEPGLKPAAAQSAAKIVGVLATEATLGSARFALLRDQISTATGVRFITQACPGLVDLIERGELDSAATRALLQRYTLPLLDSGVDTLVLGCTHYPFVLKQLEAIVQAHAGNRVTVVDTGAAIARQLARVLELRAGLRVDARGSVEGVTSGPAHDLQRAFMNLMQQDVAVTCLGETAH